MAVLVDEARWEWRGARWAHLVSDESYDELHDFARRLGKRRLGFQGDHYDIDEVDLARALDLGAERISSRELVRRLRNAGLRNRLGKPAWVRMGEWPSGVVIDGLPHDLQLAAAAIDIDTVAADAAYFVDARHRVLLCDMAGSSSVPPPARRFATGARVDGSWSIELFHPA